MRMLNDPHKLTEAPPRFTTVVGKTYTIMLQYSAGKQYPSQRPGLPDSVMYTLTNGQRAWFPVEVARLIDGLALRPREPFTICNRGSRRGWEVKRAVEQRTANETRASHLGTHQDDVIPPFAPEEATAAHVIKGNSHPNPTPPPAAVVALAPVTKLEHALKTAIQAASNAERFANEIGYQVRFDADAIKSMAITVLINGSEGGRR
jgi:hypothetical protein